MPLKNLSSFLLLSFLTLLSGRIVAKERSLNSYADKSMVQLLAVGEVENLNLLQPEVEKKLGLRLYRVPKSGDCVPETRLICSYEYYLAVTEYDEEPKQAVFNVGTYGSIPKITWLPTKSVDSARLDVTFMDLPSEAAKRLKRLKQKTFREIWEIDSTSLRIKQSP